MSGRTGDTACVRQYLHGGEAMTRAPSAQLQTEDYGEDDRMRGWGLNRYADRTAFESETAALVAMTRGIQCEDCRNEIVRSGGVVGACDEHRSAPEVSSSGQ